MPKLSEGVYRSTTDPWRGALYVPREVIDDWRSEVGSLDWDRRVLWRRVGPGQYIVEPMMSYTRVHMVD